MREKEEKNLRNFNLTPAIIDCQVVGWRLSIEYGRVSRVTRKLLRGLKDSEGKK